MEQKYSIWIGQIYISLFTNNIVRNIYPKIPENSRVNDFDDERRLRAIVVSILEYQSNQGHTLDSIENITLKVNEFRSDIENIGFEIPIKRLIRLESFFKKEITKQNIKIQKDGEKIDNPSYQLNRYVKISKLIRDFIDDRINYKEIKIEDDWEKLLKIVLKNEEGSNKKIEQNARDEKVKAIKKMANSKIHVLTGGAGTGKTTTMVALCRNETI